ncbi:hypothetical protein E2C01_091543 [Portunus trituberculatus]|uniref:Uncharacterized protein n=1 Tax=Portunus trituberculatus TaxID=210409 RepID=A0A5B7JJB3_PORTR|nr:hypothetical protein [Portunus trituberculatus]
MERLLLARAASSLPSVGPCSQSTEVKLRWLSAVTKAFHLKRDAAEVKMTVFTLHQLCYLPFFLSSFIICCFSLVVFLCNRGALFLQAFLQPVIG